MTSIKGLDPIPRNYHPSIPREHIPYLEDIRRAGNAVRILRRRGKQTASAQLVFRQACDRYQALLDQEDHDYRNPGLF